MAEASDQQDDGELGFFGKLLLPVTDALDHLGRLIILTGQTLLWMVRPPYRVTQLLSAMEFIGVQSLFIVSLTGMFSGMVLSLQLTYSLRQYGGEALVGQLVALSLLREMSPVFASLMITARAGSAMAAELGNMRVTEQIDALTTMAVSPVQYLLSPRLLGAVIVAPMLCVLFTTIGMVGAWVVAVEWLGVDLGAFLANIENGVNPIDYYMGLIKAVVFGFLVCAISCCQGFYAAGGAKGVGQATTRAVVQSAVAILIANYLLTSLLTEM